MLRDRSDVPCGQAWDDMHRGVCRDAGDCAAREIVISPAARSDLLFTMSENPRAASATREVRYFRTSHPAGGARRDRTDDLLLAKQALSQLSYGPAARNACQSVPEAKAGLPSRSSRQHSPAFAFRLRRGSLRALRKRRLVGLGRLELPTSRLSSARSNQLSYKPETWRR